MSLAWRRPCAARIAWLAAALALAASPSAWAEGPTKPTPEAQAQARDHYAKARALYQAGSYHEAITELEAALALDPNGKDLVFNLGVVHEKLGDIEEALRYFHRYEEMDLDAQERSRADAYIKRLQGARHEVEKPPPAPPPPPPAAQPPPEPRPAPPPPAHGRIDVFTIGAASVAVVGFGVGVGFGLRALSIRPKSGFVTGRDGSFSDLQNETQKAHKDAVISDVGFAVGLVGAVSAAYLYLARTRDPAPSPVRGAAPKSPPIEVSGAAMPGGGALFLGGRF